MKKLDKENKNLKIKQFFKENLKVILAIIITAILATGTMVLASYNYFAKDIEYKKSDGTKINVENALNELYTRNVQFQNTELLFHKNDGLSFSGTYTFDGKHSNVILFLWGASRDNNVLLNYDISDGNIIYDNTWSTYYDTYTKGRIVFLKNIKEGTILNYFLQCQPGIIIYGLE